MAVAYSALSICTTKDTKARKISSYCFVHFLFFVVLDLGLLLVGQVEWIISSAVDGGGRKLAVTY